MMLQEIQLRLTPEEAKDEIGISRKLANQSGIPHSTLHYKWRKRSIDARKKEIKILGTFFEISIFSSNIAATTEGLI